MSIHATSTSYKVNEGIVPPRFLSCHTRLWFRKQQLVDDPSLCTRVFVNTLPPDMSLRNMTVDTSPSMQNSMAA